MSHPALLPAGHALIVGASGVIGSAVVAEFSRRAGMRVSALSRRRPDLPADVTFAHIPADLDAAEESARLIGSLRPVTHLVYAASVEAAGLVGGWIDHDLMHRNLDMLRNVVEPVAAAGALRHVTLMQGTKAYGAHLHPIAIPARESQPRDPHANFYWLQEDYIRTRAASGGWHWTIFRPQIVLGGAVGVAMNPVPVIGVLAALAHERGEPFAYPGQSFLIHEAVDSRLVARACAWAMESGSARNEVFNITNGDIWAPAFSWPALADAMGLRSASDHMCKVAKFLATQQPVWERIAIRHDLAIRDLAAILGQSHHYLALLLGSASDAPAAPALLSTIKLRKAGFSECFDTDHSLRYWLNDLIHRKILPKMGQMR